MQKKSQPICQVFIYTSRFLLRKIFSFIAFMYFFYNGHEPSVPQRCFQMRSKYSYVYLGIKTCHTEINRGMCFVCLPWTMYDVHEYLSKTISRSISSNNRNY